MQKGLLQATLDLQRVGDTDRFIGQSHPMPSGRVFGGQVVGQAVAAARATCPDKPLNSMHGYFLRPGDVEKPIEFDADRIHDGRSFARRRVQAYQDGVAIFSMIASFQSPEDHVDFGQEMPTNIPGPDELPDILELIKDAPHSAGTTWARERPFDLRYVEGPVYSEIPGGPSRHQHIWLRAHDRLGDDPGLHQAALAYASDFSILEPVLRALNTPWATPGLNIASLDHALWFHGTFRADEWLLYSQEAIAAGSSRGLAIGRVFTQDGRHIATVAQEGMIRVPRDS